MSSKSALLPKSYRGTVPIPVMLHESRAEAVPVNAPNAITPSISQADPLGNSSYLLTEDDPLLQSVDQTFKPLNQVVATEGQSATIPAALEGDSLERDNYASSNLEGGVDYTIPASLSPQQAMPANPPEKPARPWRVIASVAVLIFLSGSFVTAAIMGTKSSNSPAKNSGIEPANILSVGDNQTLSIRGNLKVSKLTELQDLVVHGKAIFQNGFTVVGSGNFDTVSAKKFVGDGSGLTNLPISGGSVGPAGPQGPAGPSGVASCPNGTCVSLQATTPGTPETGNLNISGTLVAGGFSGNGAALTALNAANVGSGTLSDARLSANVALQNALNTFTALNNFTGGLQRGGNAVCDISNNCSYAPSTGGSGYIQNGTAIQTNANFNIQSTAAASVGGVIRGAVSQTASLLQFQNSSGSVIAEIASDGRIIGHAGLYVDQGNAAGAYIARFDSNNAAYTPIIGRAAVSQTADLLQLQNNAGGVVARFNYDGSSLLVANGNAAGQVQLGAVGPSFNAGIILGSASDTNLYRSAANLLKTDDNLQVALNLGVGYDPTTISGGVAAFNGNVGIGTSSPNAPLHVQKTSGSIAAIFDNGVSPDANSGIRIVAPISTTHTNWMIAAQQNFNGFEVTPSTAVGGTTFSTPALAILANGNVGIGTTTPAQKLEVYNGNIQASIGNFNTTTVTAPGAPTVAVNTTAGNLNGTYYYVITYPTANGQSAYGAVSAAVAPASQQVNLSAIPTGPTGVVTARKIYRTLAGGSVSGPFYLVTTINDNTTTTYTDNIADASLGAAASNIDTSGGMLQINGSNILKVTTNSTFNTALGLSVLNANTTGDYNTGVGYQSLLNNTTGRFNTGLGKGTLQANTTGIQNVAIGVDALQANTTANNNVAIGAYSLMSNTTGYYNIATGTSALQNNTTGFQNIAMGYQSLYSNTTGSYNTASGVQVLFSNTTGTGNTALGISSLYSNTTGNYNTALGYQAGYTSVGANANTSGSNNTFIGYQAGPGTTTQLTNATAIGNLAVVSASNSLVLGSINGVNGATSNTKVGIGTATPGTALEVANGTIRATSASNPTSGVGLELGYDSVFNQGFVYAFDRGTSTYKKLNLQDLLYIDAVNSKIGIGATSPNVGPYNTGLEIRNTGGTGAALALTSTVGKSFVIGSADTPAGLYFRDQTAGIYRAVIDTNGLFGINTSINPVGAQLRVNNSAPAQVATIIQGAATQTADLFQVQNSAGTVLSKFDASGNLSVGTSTSVTGGVATFNGNVGIGTTTPAAKLDVAGNINLNQVAAPATAPTVAVNPTAGNLNGTYYYTVTYVTASGDTNYGPASAAVAPASQQVNLTAIPTSGSSLVTARKLYRTTAGGANTGPFQLVTTINDNTTTTYTDNIADASLGATASKDNRTASLQVNTTPAFTAGGSGGNTWAGLQAGAANTTGYNNTTTGFGALQFNTTGYSNTAIGVNTLQANTTGFNNIALGTSALQANTTGSYNTASGTSALQANTTGANNTALGGNALYSNTTGIYNTALGVNSLVANTTGSYNTASGGLVLFSNTTGTGNTALGISSLYSNTTGIYNTALGYLAGYTSVGTNANTTGNYNTFVGYNSGPGTTTQLTNATAIGNLAVVSSSNSLVLGSINGVNGATSSVNVGIGTASPSDKLTINGTSTNTGITLLSGNAANYAMFQIGRASVEGQVAIAAAANQLSNGTVAGDMVIRNFATGGNLYLSATSTGEIRFNTGTGGGTTKLVLQNGGNVGINNSNPTQGNLAISQITNGNTVVYAKRNTDTSPTGNFLQLQTNAGVDLATIDIAGNLSVKNGTFNGTLTVNGHIISANSSGSTTIAAGAAACTTPTVSVSGNDTAGTITVMTGTGCAGTGVLATVTFAGAYGATPRVVVSADNANAAGLNTYTGSRTTTTFTLDTATTPANSTTYTFNYWVAQ